MDKIKLYSVPKIMASVEEARSFGIPEEAFRQPDLQYITAILVSTGMNLNGAYFLPSEVIQARDTMLEKALDVEHLEHFVVGSIVDRAFMKKDRELFDPVQFLAEQGSKLDSQSFDVAVSMVLWKDRFNEIAQMVEEDKFKLSMECYYKDFDIKIGDLIISKDEAVQIGLNTGDGGAVGKKVKLVDGNKEVGFDIVGRVFRDILFSGAGLVESPANPESVILETAAFNLESIKPSGLTVDLSKSGTYMKVKSKKERIDLDGVNRLSDSAGGGPSSLNPGTCVHFKKNVYDYQPEELGQDVTPEGEKVVPAPNIPGVGGDPGPRDKVVAKHWCNLFDTDCTSIAGDATDPRCLRNRINSTTKEVVSNFLELNWFMKIKDRVDRSISEADEILMKTKQLRLFNDQK